MRVIAKSRLRQFWEIPAHADSEQPLLAWYTHVDHKSIDWQNWAQVRASYRSADLVGTCVVFNIGGNKYRLITRVNYRSHVVYVLKVMTHEEYDKDQWKDECDCFTPPPQKKTVKKKKSSQSQSKKTRKRP